VQDPGRAQHAECEAPSRAGEARQRGARLDAEGPPPLRWERERTGGTDGSGAGAAGHAQRHREAWALHPLLIRIRLLILSEYSRSSAVSQWVGWSAIDSWPPAQSCVNATAKVRWLYQYIGKRQRAAGTCSHHASTSAAVA